MDKLCSILTAVTIAGALGIGAPACKSRSDGEASLPPAAGAGAAPRPSLPDVKPTAPGAGAQSVEGEAIGTTYPKERAEVGPNASGVLATVAVREGDRVKKGQLLFRLRAEDARLGEQQAEAALAAANVRLSAVQVEYDRTKRLFERKAIDEAQWQRVQAEHEAARAGVAQAKVGVAMARKRAADTAVRSPLAGVVTAKLKSEGEMVTMMPPSIVVVVEDHSALELRFRLPERDLGRLKGTDRVHAVFDAIGVERDATIARTSPNVDPTTRTVEVVADIDNADGSLKSGMLAKVTVK